MGIIAIFILVNASLVIAHHPTEDIVDAEIYAMIDEMVSGTPHADLEFDDDTGNGDDTTIITTDSVSAADVMVDDGLLDGLSLLDGTVTISIKFPAEEESMLKNIDELNNDKGKINKWSEWGRPVKITVQHPY